MGPKLYSVTMYPYFCSLKDSCPRRKYVAPHNVLCYHLVYAWLRQELHGITVGLSRIPQGFTYRHLGRMEPEYKIVRYMSLKGWHHLDCKRNDFESHTKGWLPCIEQLLRTRQRCSVARLELLPQHWIESELPLVWYRRRQQPLNKAVVQELGNTQQWTANS